MLENLWLGFLTFMHIQNVIGVFVGVTIGIIVGAIPGLTATMAISVAVPLTFVVDPVLGISFLVGVYKGAIYGGSIPAILLNIPGTPAAAATTMDGFPLAQKGEAGKGLKMALYASVIGDTFSDLVLIFVAAPIATIALLFGPADYFSLMLFALTIIGMVSGKNMVKGLIAGLLGLLLATIGIDPIASTPRFSFDILQLQRGISFIPMMIGIFGFSEVLVQTEKRSKRISAIDIGDSKDPKNRVSGAEMKRCMPTIIRGGVIGTIIGCIPGIGQSIAAYLNYSEAKRRSKHPETFGKGELEGIAAAESGNNAVDGATLIPLLTLGIPGDVVTGVLLGAFMLQGLVPGPMLFENHGPTVYGIFIGLLVANVALLFIAGFGIRFFAKVTTMPVPVLLPAIVALCVIGSYAIDNSMVDIGIMLIFGIIGYFMRKFHFPIPPLAIAFLLSDLVESNFRRSLLLSQGSPWIFFTRPISVGFLILTVFVVVGMILRSRKDRKVQVLGEDI